MAFDCSKLVRTIAQAIMYGMKEAGSSGGYKDLNSLATSSSKGLRKCHVTENDVCLFQKLENCGYWDLWWEVWRDLGKGGEKVVLITMRRVVLRQRKQKSRHGKGRKRGAVMKVWAWNY